MEASIPPPLPNEDQFAWLAELSLEEPKEVAADLAKIWESESSPELLNSLQRQLIDQAEVVYDMAAAIHHLRLFLQASSQPAAVLEQFHRDAGAMPLLLKIFATSPTLARWLIDDPDQFEQLCAGHQPAPTRQQLVQQILAGLENVDQIIEAASVISQYYSRELIRIACDEFVHGLAPEQVGRQLANIADAILEGALQFVIRRLADRRGMPQRPDGTTPELTVLGLGALGGQEMSYSSSLQLIFVYDSIDSNNVWHRDFYQSVVSDVVDLLKRDHARRIGFDIDLRQGPRYEVGVHICSYREAIRIYETAGRSWQRLSFVKARVVAGSKNLGQALLERLQPWIYPRFLTRADLTEIGMLQHKLEKRAEQSGSEEDVARSEGGRDDLELTVQFLQLLHGGELSSVRCGNTYEGLVALERAGCVTNQEAALLLENYARLCRLQHQLTVVLDRNGSRLPKEERSRKRIAWQLGVRSQEHRGGDLKRFEILLSDTFRNNRKMINHLMLQTIHQDEVAIETELLLDPDPDASLVETTMHSHRLTNPQSAMHDLLSLSSENVSYLSPHRCRHFLSSIAPTLLKQISRTPDPDAALASLVKVTDSLGAKATLWELLGNSEPTMELMVRLCATTPYLSSILTNNPGMIDELIDSLIMNRLPSTERLDAHSIEVCRGAIDIGKILHSFKNGAHLMIGVRDMLGKESLEATHRAIGDTAEACLRRVIDRKHDELAERFGDPVDEQGEVAELVTLAVGKFGGREPNYHSDLDAVFLYSAEGQTQRRVGGHRATLSNEQFFNQLTQQIVTSINDPSHGGRLYELDSRLRDSGEDGVWAVTVDGFLNRFRQDLAPLWQRMALCKARAVSGSRGLRARVDVKVAQVLVETAWRSEMVNEIRSLRERMEKTARAENLKRGAGGTMDVEFAAQALTLRFASQDPRVIHTGTTTSLKALRDADFIPEQDAATLINGYRTLRRIEANLRLMNTAARHELPEDPDSMSNLAFLMNEQDPAMIVAQCQQARKNIRSAYNRVLDGLN
ncbi:MAG: glutamate-ammonia-ligase adenylyltransferase [Planctomycetota bacterium]|nr:glutamate-ammonia-ligase adenylyltransferase [Planctomycetota bacterium]